MPVTKYTNCGMIESDLEAMLVASYHTHLSKNPHRNKSILKQDTEVIQHVLAGFANKPKGMLILEECYNSHGYIVVDTDNPLMAMSVATHLKDLKPAGSLTVCYDGAIHVFTPIVKSATAIRIWVMNAGAYRDTELVLYPINLAYRNLKLAGVSIVITQYADYVRIFEEEPIKVEEGAWYMTIASATKRSACYHYTASMLINEPESATDVVQQMLIEHYPEIKKTFNLFR